MLPFSALSKTEAPETSLRMSLPEAGLAITPTVGAAFPLEPSLVLVVEELPDQAIRATRGLHLGHMPSLFKDLDAGVLRGVLRM